MENKLQSFLNYANTKKWDASLLFYDGEHIAILNPVNIKGIFEGKSRVSIGDAIDECKKELIKGAK